MKDFKKLYEELPDYRNYVDKFCKSYGLSAEAALEHRLVRAVGEYYKSKTSEHPIYVCVGAGFEEDKSC